MLAQCWAIVADEGPTLRKHCVSALCSLKRHGYNKEIHIHSHSEHSTPRDFLDLQTTCLPSSGGVRHYTVDRDTHPSCLTHARDMWRQEVGEWVRWIVGRHTRHCRWSGGRVYQTTRQVTAQVFVPVKTCPMTSELDWMSRDC